MEGRTIFKCQYCGCHGIHWFFFGIFRNFTQEFEGCFTEGDEEQDNGQGIKRPSFGWLGVAYKMAGYDYIRMDAYFKLSAIEFLNAFMIWRDIDRGNNAQHSEKTYL